MFRETIAALAISASEQEDSVDRCLNSPLNGEGEIGDDDEGRAHRQRDRRCASSPPLTWRNRHRKPKKDCSPLTKQEVLKIARQLAGKYYGIVSAKQKKMESAQPDHVSKWDGDHLVEETLMYRLVGDAVQKMVDLIERIQT